MGITREKGLRWAFASASTLPVFLGIQIVAGVVASLVLAVTSAGAGGEAYEQAYANALTWVVLVSQLVCFGVALPWHRLESKRVRRPEPMGPARAVMIVAGLLVLGVAVQLVISVVLTLLLPLLPDLQQDYSEVMEDIGGPGVIDVISTVVMAPLCEELFFRGVALDYARRAFRAKWLAVVFQALLFGIAHGNLVQGCYAFLLGMLLGVIRLRWGRLWPCMVLHLGMNGSSYLLGLLDSLPEEVAGVVFLGLGAVSLAAVVIVTVLLVRGVPKDENLLLPEPAPAGVAGVPYGSQGMGPVAPAGLQPTVPGFAPQYGTPAPYVSAPGASPAPYGAPGVAPQYGAPVQPPARPVSLDRPVPPPEPPGPYPRPGSRGRHSRAGAGSPPSGVHTAEWSKNGRWSGDNRVPTSENAPLER